MQGLQDAIGLSVVHPTWQDTRPGVDTHRGWTFAAPGDPPFAHPNGGETYPADGCIPDTVNGAKFVRDIYDMSGVAPGAVPTFRKQLLFSAIQHTSTVQRVVHEHCS
jgi:hypothetical protein